MRKLLILSLLIFGGFKAYGYYAESSIAAYDEDGRPLTLVFTFNNCPPCKDEIALLRQRDITFTEYNLSDSVENQKIMHSHGGGRMLPYTVSGNRTTAGYQREAFIGFLAEAYGDAVLTPYEKKILSKNFDESGSPIVVMYSTARCGYCKMERKYLNDKGVDFVERDIERDSSAMQDYAALRGSGTPLTYVGYKRISGYNQKELSEALSSL